MVVYDDLSSRVRCLLSKPYNYKTKEELPRMSLTMLLLAICSTNKNLFYHLIGLLQKFGITCTLRLHFVILSPLFLMQTKGAFICTFSLLISISIPLWTSKFWNRFTISSKYFDMACYIKRETYSGPHYHFTRLKPKKRALSNFAFQHC